MTGPLRVLVVGCGEIAFEGHLPALRTLADAGLVTVVACDADPARAAAAGARFAVPSTTDWRTAASEVDAAVVCVAPGPNAVIAAAAVDLGLHVLCEKPPGRTPDQAWAMAAAAARHPELVTMVGFNRRCFPLYGEVLAVTADLGPPAAFAGRFSREALGSEPSNTASDWITADSCHSLDLAVAAMGFPTSAAVSRRAVGPGLDNVWALHLETPRGGAVLSLDYAAGTKVERYRLTGPGWEAVIDPPARATVWRDGADPVTWTSAELTGSTKGPVVLGFVAEHRRFLDAIAGRTPPPDVDFAYGARFMDLVETLLRTPDRSLARLTGGPPSTPPPAAGPAGPTVLLHYPLPAQQRFFSIDALTDLGRACRLVDWGGWVGPELEEARVLVTGRGGGKLPADVWSHAPNLALVVWVGASVRSLRPEELIDRGVQVCNTADAVAAGVAEHCLLLSLAGRARLPEPAPLAGAIVGLVGWGHTARHFASLLAPFDVRLLVASDAAEPAELQTAGATPATVDEILRSADVISLHKGHVPGAPPVLGATELDLIPPGAVLVNTARAELVDEAALVARLTPGDIVAALDVFHDEPLPAEHPLRALGNVVLTPHTASATRQEERRMGAQALGTVQAWLAGRPVDAIGGARLARMT